LLTIFPDLVYQASVLLFLSFSGCFSLFELALQDCQLRLQAVLVPLQNGLAALQELLLLGLLLELGLQGLGALGHPGQRRVQSVDFAVLLLKAG
jgi:hypothetical protein